MLRSRLLTIPCRGFRSPRSALPRPSDRESPPSPRRRNMAREECFGGYPWNRQSPRIGDGVHALKATVHHNDKDSPMVFSNSGKEHLQLALGTGDAVVRGGCSKNFGSPELCKSGAFDICMPQKVEQVKLKPSLFTLNRGKRRENEQAKMDPQHIRLRPGMILLKNFLKQRDQVEIIRQCQSLGVGFGGFYQPGYRDGAKLSLHMMCLGKNWDPQTRLYQDIRPTDGAEVPQIPVQFSKLVEAAIQESQFFIKQHTGHLAEAELPNMSRDLCIVNFYSKNGKLGLHQDADESRESRDKALPIVSFSLGDTADFLYGDSRGVDKTAVVKLENGDVLIFGGKSRHIFHGVSCIHPGTAPSGLIDETNLRPGRLNLTFRQF